jgi:hypothetical protein
MKKLLSVILAVVMLTSALSVTATSAFADTREAGVIHFNDDFLENN